MAGVNEPKVVVIGIKGTIYNQWLNKQKEPWKYRFVNVSGAKTIPKPKRSPLIILGLESWPPELIARYQDLIEGGAHESA